MRAKLRNLGTMARFVLVSTIVALAVGAGLWFLLSRAIEADAREREVQAAELLATTAVMPALDSDTPGDGLNAATTVALDDLVRREDGARRLRDLVIRNRRGVAVYASTPQRTQRNGDGRPVAPVVRAATSGTVTVAVPLGAANGRPVAVAEIRIASASLLHRKVLLAAGIVGALVMLVGAMLLTIRRTLRVLGRKVEKHQHQALHDPLTSLPNRTLFNDRVAQCARERQRGGETAAVMLIDLDRFKEVNDTLGHRCGDLLLAEVSRRLSGRLRKSDTVARLGGDEFGILLPLVDGVPGATTVVENLRKALVAPFLIDGHSLRVGASLGIALMEDSHDPVTLLQRADQAMYRAKRERTGHAFYDAQIDGNERDQLALLGELRRAIGRGELRLLYQPKADLATGRIRGVEALVRWQHPKRGLLAPHVFIPLAERNGLIRHLTFWILDEAMRQAREWAENGRGLKVAVNLSQESLLDETMPAEIIRVLERHRVPAKALEIEITESALVSDLEAASDALSTLAEMGSHCRSTTTAPGSRRSRTSAPSPWDASRSIVRSYRECWRIRRARRSSGRRSTWRATSVSVWSRRGWRRAPSGMRWRSSDASSPRGYLISRPISGPELRAWLERRGNHFVLPPEPEESAGGAPLFAGAAGLPDFA